jgi:drug/metabolite transporter (DMT)-like permease
MRKKAMFAVLIAATLAGSSGVFIKNLHIPATSIAFIRCALPVLLMGGLMAMRGIPFFRGNYRVMLGASALNALRIFFFFSAYLYTSIGNAVLISYTWPIFVSIFSVLFLGENISRRNIWLMGLAFVGMLVVYANKPFSFADRDFAGMMFALGAAISYAMILIIFKRESNVYSPTETIFYQNLLGVPIFLPFILVTDPAPALSDWLIAGSFTVFLGIFAFQLFFFGLKNLKASTASNLAYIEIVSALLFSTLWLQELLTWNMVVGGAIIMGTTFWLQKK